jgi:hypothetical protein
MPDSSASMGASFPFYSSGSEPITGFDPKPADDECPKGGGHTWHLALRARNYRGRVFEILQCCKCDSVSTAWWDPK